MEDASEIDARNAERFRKEAGEEWQKQSQVVQRYLPRPTLPNPNVLLPPQAMVEAQVDIDFFNLLQLDFPAANTSG